MDSGVTVGRFVVFWQIPVIKHIRSYNTQSIRHLILFLLEAEGPECGLDPCDMVHRLATVISNVEICRLDQPKDLGPNMCHWHLNTVWM